MRRLRDIHVWLVGYDMVSLSLYHILVLARFISNQRVEVEAQRH